MEYFSRSYKLMNKPLYWQGFTPLQIALIFGGNFFSFMFFAVIFGNSIVVYLIFSISIGFSVFIGKEIYKENKKGCPDYVEAYQVREATKRYFIDQNHFFEYL